MARPLMRFSTQQGNQHKKPAGMQCDTSNAMLENKLFTQLNEILTLDHAAAKQKNSKWA